MYSIGNLLYLVKERLASKPEASTLQRKMLASDLIVNTTRSRVIGGAERDRTADLLRARQALSQLSYSP